MRIVRWAAVLAATLIIAPRAEPRLVSQRVSLQRHFTPADRISGRYQYVPFTVPPGTGTLRVTYSYDRANGDNVVDLGVFEPGPLDLGTPAFRGYSGGNKAGFTIGMRGATPGYRSGPLPPGQWHVLLGLYKVRDAGVDVTIEVDTDPFTQAGAPEPARMPAPPAARAGWFMGALHAHTQHSDGSVDPVELMRLTREGGFDFVTVTDHNNTTHSHDLARQHADGARPLWIIGEEVTTPGGHANAWGLKHGDWIDFRVNPGDPRIVDLVSQARRLGALFSVNHPASTCPGCGWEHAWVEGIDSIEISNGRHGEVAGAIAMWDGLLRQGRRITAVGSSDWHGAPSPLDVANVRVYAESLTQAAVLDAIRAGRVIVMTGGQYATPQFAVRAGAQTAAIGGTLAVPEGTLVTIEVTAPDLAFGRLAVVANGHAPAALVPLDDRGRARVEHPVQHGYLRFELLRGDKTPVAYTNPIFVVRP